MFASPPPAAAPAQPPATPRAPPMQGLVPVGAGPEAPLLVHRPSMPLPCAPLGVMRGMSDDIWLDGML